MCNTYANQHIRGPSWNSQWWQSTTLEALPLLFTFSRNRKQCNFSAKDTGNVHWGLFQRSQTTVQLGKEYSESARGKWNAGPVAAPFICRLSTRKCKASLGKEVFPFFVKFLSHHCSITVPLAAQIYTFLRTPKAEIRPTLQLSSSKGTEARWPGWGPPNDTTVS